MPRRLSILRLLPPRDAKPSSTRSSCSATPRHPATLRGEEPMVRHRIAGMSLVVVTWVLLAASAWAQQAPGGIAGVVRDTSGAVLPGVTVEAASPALIEKVRSVVSDAQGQYKSVDLRPGTYVVTFTLPGFSTVRREGVELTTGFTATVNADLKVGT